MAAVHEAFRPEFLNRIDDVIVFDKLTEADLRQITEIQLRSLRQRLQARRIDLQITDEALDLLAERGYDPVFGARPLKRVIQKQLVDPIAAAVLEGRYGEGDTVKVAVEDGELTLG
jgi:ATP-dependent Clp protease ATP-binding subunit ClpB